MRRDRSRGVLAVRCPTIRASPSRRRARRIAARSSDATARGWLRLEDVTYTMQFACEDGRWIEAALDDAQQLARGSDDTGGVLVGSDPSCDIVLSDDGVEPFHFRIYGAGHHWRFVEMITGSLVWRE